MDVKDDVEKTGVWTCRQYACVCERREAATPGHVGFKIKNAHTLRTSARF